MPPVHAAVTRVAEELPVHRPPRDFDLVLLVGLRFRYRFSAIRTGVGQGQERR